MKQPAKILLPIIVIGMGLVGAWTLIRSKPEVERSQPENRSPAVRVMEVRAVRLPLTVKSQGTVRPRVESSLVAQVAGRIDWVASNFAEGGAFQKGDDLVRIEDRDFQLAVSQAEAQVAQAVVGVELEEAEAELAQEEWADLIEGEPTALALREPQLAEARARLQAAEAGLEQARLDLERTRIRAPFAGRIRSTQVDLGQFVGRGANLAQLYSTDAVEIRLPVARDQLAFLELGTDLSLEKLDGSGPAVDIRGTIGNTTYSWAGRIVRTGSEFDAKTRMLPLFARVDDPYGSARLAAGAPLPVGLFVDAEIAGRQIEDAFVVPRDAVRGGNQVLVVDGDKRLRFRQVEPLRIDRDVVVLTSGLSDGETICISNLDTAIEGMRVRTVIETPLLTEAQREEDL